MYQKNSREKGVYLSFAYKLCLIHRNKIYNETIMEIRRDRLHSNEYKKRKSHFLG